MKYAIACFSLAVIATPVWAHHFDDDPDMRQSILNVHQNSFPVSPWRGGSATEPGSSYSSVPAGSGMSGGTGTEPQAAPDSTAPEERGVRPSDPELGDPDSGIVR